MNGCARRPFIAHRSSFIVQLPAHPQIQPVPIRVVVAEGRGLAVLVVGPFGGEAELAPELEGEAAAGAVDLERVRALVLEMREVAVEGEALPGERRAAVDRVAALDVR